MNVFWSNVIKWVIQIFGGIIAQMTPGLIEEIKKFLIEIYKKALATPNPWDDFGVGLLLDMFGVPRPPPEG